MNNEKNIFQKIDETIIAKNGTIVYVQKLDLLVANKYIVLGVRDVAALSCRHNRKLPHRYTGIIADKPSKIFQNSKPIIKSNAFCSLK